MEFADRQIPCLDCGKPFTFTAGEQEFYSRKGFKEEPKRCKPCRDLRKNGRGERVERASADQSNVRRAVESEDAAASDGAGWDRGNQRAPLSNIDDDIGNRMPGMAAPAPAGGPRGPREVREVRGNGRAPRSNPRPPSGGGGGGGGASGGGGGGGGPARELFDAVCAQCGTAARVPFRPVAGRPVYCRDCYGNRG